ncbi:hypothetical protein K8P63_16435 [Sphingomonas nostoxanthinifaciens]|nr:hypothetical protein [Sphingomonas nostoxanthinifaciens]UAK23931.1 hypothetical protein K8P63_16435 [Sphingomonas nostoxanthinifaciens]
MASATSTHGTCRPAASSRCRGARPTGSWVCARSRTSSPSWMPRRRFEPTRPTTDHRHIEETNIMKSTNLTLIALAMASAATGNANAQAPAAAPAPSVTITMKDPTALQLVRSTSLPGIEGDFEFFAADLKRDLLYVPAEVHHTIEIFKASTGEHLRSVGGVKTAHGMVYVPESNELIITDGGDSSTRIFSADDMHQIERIPMIDGAVSGKTDSPDDAIYYAKRRIVYIANGGKSANLPYSELAELNVDTHKFGASIRVEGDNLEGMAIDEANGRMFINIRDKKQVGVIDLNQRKVVATWDVGLNRNTALGYDPASNVVFVGSRQPGLFTVLDGTTGAVLAQLSCVDMTGSLIWDPVAKRVYISGLQGISVFQQESRNYYTEVLRTPNNGAKTATYIPQLKQYYVAHAKNALDDAGLLVYRVPR